MTTGIPGSCPGSHSPGAISEPALGGVCPVQAFQPPCTGPGLQPSFPPPQAPDDLEEKEAGELARLLGKRRAPQQASCMGAFAAIRGAQTQALPFPPAATGE